jgi:hypothetical protein
MSDEIDSKGVVAENVFALVMSPERSMTIFFVSAGLSISARIAEPALAKPLMPLRVDPDPVIRIPPRPVGSDRHIWLCRRTMSMYPVRL